MKDELIDRAIAEVRSQEADEATMTAAAARVRARIIAPAAADSGIRQLHGCSDFQAIAPAYVAGRLSEARRLLLEDHIASCVHCRHAVERERTGKVRTLPRPVVVENRIAPQWKWAAAAALAASVLLGAWQMYRVFAPDAGIRAVVSSVRGTLLAVSDRGGAPVFAGREIGEHQPVRTSWNSDAVLRLTDGSQVEMASRSEVWIARTALETTIHLTRGSIIVHAAKQRHGALHVATRDCLVSVKGTIFAVTEGTRGARVSVVEGAVQVKEGSQTRTLHPGEQATTNAALATTSVEDDISWSRDSAQYLALLGEFSAMAKQLAQTPQPGLRYSSQLAELAPENTVVYGAMPNIGPLLSQANQIFDDRLKQSPVLQQWWSQHQSATGPTLDEMVQQMRAFSDYLGDEIALALTMDSNTKQVTPLVMATVTKTGLADSLQNQLGAKPEIQVLTALPASPPASSGKVYAYISGNYLFVSPSVTLLSQADAAAKGNGGRGDYPLYSQVTDAYKDGVTWLLAADMEQIRATSVQSVDGASNAQQRAALTGMANLSSVVLERKEVNGVARNTAALSFSGNRSGLAGWLAEPGPIGALDFVSPNASMVSAAALADHGRVVWDLINTAEADPHFTTTIQQLNNNGGAAVNAIAQSLGGDFTFAIDGALLPVPSWKMAVEVTNISNCEWGIEQLVSHFNQLPNAPAKLTLTQAQVNGRTYYAIAADKIPLQVHYVFVDNYLLAAATQDMLTQAIQNRETGYTLARSDTFRAQFPNDSNVNFSGFVYYNVGPALSAVAAGANATNALTAAQKASINAFAAGSKPTLVYAYGQPDRILVSSSGGFFGLNLDTLSLPAIIGGTMHHQLTGLQRN